MVIETLKQARADAELCDPREIVACLPCRNAADTGTVDDTAVREPLSLLGGVDILLAASVSFAYGRERCACCGSDEVGARYWLLVDHWGC
jgi:hypothetical protein